MSVSARSKFEQFLRVPSSSDIQDHLQRLFDAAAGNCLEIGVRAGVSTSAILSGLEQHGGHLWSIDIDPDCGNRWPQHPQWTFICADSLKPLPVELPSHFTMALIDGDHAYESAISDLQTFAPLAAKVFVHDTDHIHYPGVRRAVEEFCKASNRSVVYHAGSMGMAEITCG